MTKNVKTLLVEARFLREEKLDPLRGRIKQFVYDHKDVSEPHELYIDDQIIFEELNTNKLKVSNEIRIKYFEAIGILVSELRTSISKSDVNAKKIAYKICRLFDEMEFI
jgi:predicted nucleic acid-binding protein